MYISLKIKMRTYFGILMEDSTLVSGLFILQAKEKRVDTGFNLCLVSMYIRACFKQVREMDMELLEY